VNGRNDEEVKIYPNPVQDVLHVEVAGRAKVQLIDVAGNVLFDETVLNSVEIDLASLRPGTYLLYLNGQARKFQKL
jgi:hypothetical protein